MAERQRGTENYSLPRDKRHRKPTSLTLSPTALAQLEALAQARGESRSAVVEALILAAHARLPAASKAPAPAPAADDGADR